jgi:glycosyltransferase involved in cell wall biosynthesis
MAHRMLSRRRTLDQSDLSRVIAPEIKADAFYEIIRRLAATEVLETVLEIGSSSGGGSTEAFVAGLSGNRSTPKLFCIELSKPRFSALQEAYRSYPFVHCYNRSTVRVDQFPTPEAVATFYHTVPSGLRKFPLPLVLDWLRQDVQYVRESGVPAGAIETIKAEHGIDTFDMVLIDGSEFTGAVEYELVRGAKFILLDDTNTFKCHAVRQNLLNDPMYDLLADDQDLRNGYSVFRRRATARRVGDTLPIHFFTIVLNGEPFIRYHADVFQRLTVPWHWHVVEGVAALTHDTAWSVAGGGHIAASVHDQGRSNDGTSAYLDEVAGRFPENVTIYRKPLGEFWDGKREMVNAPLPNITEPCLLWQVDNDELWTVEQILSVHDLFTRNPTRTAAYYWCWYYVGPEKIISTRYNYAQNPQQEWLRTWRYRPGAVWAAHEPPILVAGEDDAAKRIDIAKVNPFTQDETEQAGAVFHHFAYATEQQLSFKELYYGYKDARAQWLALQSHRGSGALKDYFGWVSDNTMFDDAAHYLVDPIARFESRGQRWTFDGAGSLPEGRRPAAVQRPRILIDGLYWQYLSSGIGRLWENVLREWAASGFADNVIVLDRAGTAPRIRGVHYWTIAAHDYQQTGRDSLYLETICRQLDADAFASTYYSTPTTTASFFVGYDMIPEVLGLPDQEETWREKRRAILHASGHSMISRNSAKDLKTVYPSITGGSTYVTFCAIDRCFTRPADGEVEAFRQRHGLGRDAYVLMVGERLGYGGYKNGSLAFRALADLPADNPLVLVCVGGHQEIEAEFRELAPGLDVRRLALDDAELRAGYGGAHALLYPSKYEGFGMPPLEAMACGTPAIVCRNSSLPEVIGEAALYVDENDPTEMTDAIVKLFDPAVRTDLIARGLRQATQFSFARTARELAKALVETHERRRAGPVPGPAASWTELRAFQRDCQQHRQVYCSDVDPAPAAEQPGVEVVPVPVAPVAERGELERAMHTIESMRNSPFWQARELAVRTLRKVGLRRRV